MVDTAFLSTAFLAFTGLVALCVAAMLLRTFRAGAGSLALVGLGAWLVYAGAFSYLGLLRDPSMRPPGVVLVVGPVFTCLVLVVGVFPSGKRLAAALPIAMLIGFQAFRIGVELAMGELHQLGLVPHLMTLAGGNVEMLVGLTAPLAAWIATRGARGRQIALLWNALGLLSLINIATRSVLSAPGPLNLLHTEVPNIGFGIFPYGLIPGFMAPLAFATHMLTFRAIRMAGKSPGTSRMAPLAS